MSGRQWIDAFFRKRLEHRMFPVEDGELEDVRTLLQQRNGTTEVFREGGGFSKWWLSSLIPVAGLLWWAFGGSGAGPEDVPFTALPRTTRMDTDEQHAERASHNNGPSDRGSPAAIAIAQERPRTTSGASADSKDDLAPEIGAGAGSHALRSDLHATSAASANDGTDEQVDAAPATPVDRQMQGTDPASADRIADQGINGSGSFNEDPLSKGGATRAHEQERNDAAPMADQLHLTAHGDAEMVNRMQLRMPASFSTVPQPIQREVPVLERLPLGALHFFGGPLAVRTRSSSDGRSGAEAGSLFGLEYRVRTRHFVWATGVHYGSYALKADRGATDVKLNFVEVPLLASVQLSRGRFGFAMQGGVSVDLLFNSRGSYRVEGGSPSTGFPDDAFRTANLSWLLRPQASYHVNEYLSVNAGPLWKAQFGAVASAGPLDGAKVSSAGGTIGITWRLERSTF